MADRTCITVFFPTPLIFRYHLPLMTLAVSLWPWLQFCFMDFFPKLRYFADFPFLSLLPPGGNANDIENVHVQSSEAAMGGGGAQRSFLHVN
jgi:hypothetical protein